MKLNNNILSIINTASKYPIITRVGVFGSYARGEQTEDSDIDILFDYKELDEDNVINILDYGDELINSFKALNIELDYVSYQDLLTSRNNMTRKSILKDVIWVYEREDNL